MMAWHVVCGLVSWTLFERGVEWIIFQNAVLLMMASLMLIIFGQWATLFVRPFLAMIVSIVFAFLCYSVDDLDRIMKRDIERGLTGQTSFWIDHVQVVLPPLHRLDLSFMVGYEDVLSWGVFWSLVVVAFAWATLFYFAALRRFSKMDL